jgi:hypothetical protein
VANNPPNGFYRLIGDSGEEYLCFHCAKCNVSYNDIPQNGWVNFRGEKIETIFCCGKQIKIGKPQRTVRVADQRRGTIAFI